MNKPLRPTTYSGVAWTGVDSSSGQDISFQGRCLGMNIHVYTTGTADYVNYFWITPITGKPDSDAMKIATNPHMIPIAAPRETTVFNVMAASGETVDVYIELLK